MTIRRRIMCFADYYVPGSKAGGPIRSIDNLVHRLKEHFDFLVVTRDRDSGDTRAYRGISPGTWQMVDDVPVCYLSPKDLRPQRLVKVIRDMPHDVQYLNSFFSPRLSAVPLACRRLRLMQQVPVVVAPRGEFSRNALALKARRKRFFRLAASAMGLHTDVTWHATSVHEAQDIRDAVGNTARIVTVPNLPSLLAEPPPYQGRRQGDALRVLFLARIAPIKNLPFVFKVLAQVHENVSLRVVGSSEDRAYTAYCYDAARTLPKNVTVCFEPPVGPADVPALLAANDLLFLPTLGENFGHAIYEAFAAGTPALISNLTPWRGLELKGIGWDLPLSDVSRFARVIETLVHETPAVTLSRRAACVRHARAFADDKRAVDGYVSLFTQAIDGG